MTDTRLQTPIQQSSLALAVAERAQQTAHNVSQFFSGTAQKIMLMALTIKHKRQAAEAARFASMSHEEKREYVMRQMGGHDDHLLRDILGD